MAAHGLELLNDELAVATVLVQVTLERRTVGFIIAVTAPNAGMRSTFDGPTGSGTVDPGTIVGKEVS